MTLLSLALLSPFSWTAIGAPLANHLWQSTVFAGVVWLLTLLLRKNRAQSRYVLWLVASAKFLVPFSLLVALGSHLGWSRPAAPQPRLFIAMESIGQPFEPALPAPTLSHAAPGAFATVARFLPVSLVVLWSVGCLFVLFMWYLRWRRLTALRRTAPALNSGRELEVLRRLERTARLPQQIDLVLSKSALEPGILGVFRPILLLPAGISEKLTDAQLESVVAHELCHVRRRDNLAAALHMFVEAIFWFHPLVWWMGAQLVEERERACDEEVLSRGADPHVYAEGILKVCKFYLESPLPCSAGVTGSNLKKRIEAIMSNRIAPKLELGKRLVLSTLGVTALVGPIAFGLLRTPQSRAQAQPQNDPTIAPVFETASIKPDTTGEPMAGFTVKWRPMQAIIFKFDKFLATNETLKGLIRAAYQVQNSQITGGPDWLDSEKFDVNATIGSSLMDELSKVSREEANQERLRMLQNLLADRFKLALHRETRQAEGYDLVTGKNGPKLQRAKADDKHPDGLKDPQDGPTGPRIWVGPCKLVGQGVPISALVRYLSQELNSVVVDKTNLQGNYDFTLDCHTAFMERGESIVTVLPEQLGLELQERTLPVDMLVIDHAEQLTGDQSSQAQPQAQNASPVASKFDGISIKPKKTGDDIQSTTPPSFQDVSIAPTRSAPTDMTSNFVRKENQMRVLTATNVSVKKLIAQAYGLGESQISGGPDWINVERYDITAKMPDSLRGQVEPAFQKLITDRFKLALHRETSRVPGYALVIAPGGSKLRAAKPGDAYADGLKELNDPQGRPLGAGFVFQFPPPTCKLVGQAVPITTIVDYLSKQLSTSIVDETGLKAKYDITLDCHTAFMERGQSSLLTVLLTVLPEQLGLELKPQASQLQTLVIDRVERPQEN